MSNDMLEIPRKKTQSSGGRQSGKKSPSGKIAAVVLILALAALAVWKLVPGDEMRQLTDNARQKLHEVVDKATSSEGEAQSGSTTAPGASGGTGQVSGSLGDLPSTEMGSSGNADNSEGGTGASLNTVSGPGGAIVQAPDGVVSPVIRTTPEPGAAAGGQTGPDDVDKALAGKTSLDASRLTPDQRASLPSVGKGLSENSAPADAGRDGDSVVTMTFIRDMASWLVNSYQSGRGAAQGKTAASFVSANMRYGTALTGLRHAGNDPVRGREAVLNYMYTPGMLDALYRLYEERFMAAMDTAMFNRKQPLSVAQTADMFALYASLFRQTASGLRGVAALPDLHGKLAAVRKAGQAVIKTNAAFADILFAFEEARDAGNKAQADSLRGKLTASTKASEQAIQARAWARTNLADAIKRGAGGKTPGEDTLLYMAEWVDRRGTKSAAATSMAADILDRLAVRFEDRAGESAH